MPVRIYDISKKLGLENKEVLTKAKALGIAAARVASSSLDKITAEYLEQQLLIEHPNLAHSAPAPVAHVPQVNEPILVVNAPPPEVAPTHEPEVFTMTSTAVIEAEPPPPEVSHAAPA